jgi:hypothetical protein
MLAVAAAAWALSACGGQGSIVDGWGIGAPYTCGANTDPDPECPCAALLPLAGHALDRRDPGHAPVVEAQLHEEGPDAAGSPVIRSSPFLVAVFRLADGSTRAIGVGYPGVSTEPMALDYGP